MNKKKPAENEQEPAFEQSLAELEKIVRQLEQGGNSLDQDLEGYARAIKLIKQCHGRLSQAERSIQLLSGVKSDGTPISQPMEDQRGTSLEQKQAQRSQRRTAIQDDTLF